MPNPLENKRIVLGVTGSIPAYKAVDLASRLNQHGALVDVILSEDAAHFITPLTFQSVTDRKAFTDENLWGDEGHVVYTGLGHAADLVLLAPASANTIAKLAHGISDNLLTLTILAARCPIVIAPAMDASMFDHPATQENLTILKNRGALVIGPGPGRQSTGLVGFGRLVEPVEILAEVRYMLSRKGQLAGKKIVITAGATQEPIDPVRFITNRSSGRQAYAIAQTALDAGANVALISAPTALLAPVGAKKVAVRTTEEMFNAVMAEMDDTEILVMAAAVADFRCAHPSEQKIRRQAGSPDFEMVPTVDILSAVNNHRIRTDFPNRVIAFAAETENLIENALAKLEARNLDMIVVNDITAPDVGFEGDTNRVTLIFSDGRIEELPLRTKEQVAENIINKIQTWVIE